MSAAVTIANWCSCYGCAQRGQGTCGCFICPECGGESDVLLPVVDINEYGREVREACATCRACDDCGGTDEHTATCPELTKWDVAGESERDESRFERETWEER